MAVTRINNKDFKEAFFKASQVEFTDTNGAKWITTIDSDPFRESLLKSINEFNAKNPTKTIKTTEEPASSGAGWIYLTQFIPMIVLGMFAICTLSLAILAYKALFNKRVD